MWVRTQLKIGWNDLLLGALRAVFPPQREAQLQKAESFFSEDGKWMAAFSVRTGFELLLRSLDLMAGDEVIFSAVNVKGMVKIVTELGLVPVPVDIDFGGLAPSSKLLEAAYPVQPEKKHLKRIVSAASIKIVSSRLMLGIVYRYYRKQGRNYEEELSNKVRDVAHLKQKGGLHYQPSASLLWMMNRRMRQLNEGDLAIRTQKGRHLAGLLRDVAMLPGQTSQHHDYWLFSVVADKPNGLIDALREEGFDTGGLPRSQTVEAPKNRCDIGLSLAKDMLDAVVVVPCYGSMPDHEIEREAAVIRSILMKTGMKASQELAKRMDET